jgi:hypothetical protein
MFQERFHQRPATSVDGMSPTVPSLAPLPTLAGCFGGGFSPREIALNCMTYSLAQPAECSEATRPKSAYLNRFPASLISPAVSILHALGAPPGGARTEMERGDHRCLRQPEARDRILELGAEPVGEA